MVRTVIFDLDGTLYDYDAAHAVGFGVLSEFAQTALGIPPADFRRLHREAMAEQERRMGFSCGSSHNRIIRFQIILEWLEQPIRYAREMCNLYWGAFLRTVTPYPGAADCLRTLRADGYRVGIGTNMTADYQFEKLDRLGLLDLIDFMLTSEEAGVEKPDPLFFAHCVEKAGCPVENCLFVGDNPVLDVAGALAFGMPAVWFRPMPSGMGNGGQTENQGQAGNTEQTENQGQAENAGQAENQGQAGNAEQTENQGQAGNTEQTKNNVRRSDAPEIPASLSVPPGTPPEAADAPQINSFDQLPPLLARL